MALKEALTEEFIEQTIESLKTAKAFTVEQTPQVIQEIITWGMVENITTAVAFGVLAFAAFQFGRYLWDEVDWEKTEPMAHGAFALCMFLGVLLVGTAVDTFAVALKAYFTPRLYLLEYFSGLLK